VESASGVWTRRLKSRNTATVFHLCVDSNLSALTKWRVLRAAPAAACCYFFSSLYTSFIMYSAPGLLSEKESPTPRRVHTLLLSARCRDALFETRGVTFFTLYTHIRRAMHALARGGHLKFYAVRRRFADYTQQRLPTHFHVVHFPLFPSKRIFNFYVCMLMCLNKQNMHIYTQTPISFLLGVIIFHFLVGLFAEICFAN
jgi:hypothetical protein